MKQEPCWQVSHACSLILLMVGLNQLNIDSKSCTIPNRPSVDEISAASVRKTVPDAIRVAGVKSWL